VIGSNRLLDALPVADRQALDPYLERVTLPIGRSVFEPGDDITHAIFPCQGTVLTLLTVLQDGAAVEAATIGHEGAVGAIVSDGFNPAFGRATVHIPGQVLRIEAPRLDAAKANLPSLREMLSRYADALLAQLAQSVACNAVHAAEARTCRWLLNLRDRVESDALPVTQEALAEMLGVRRTTVTRLLAGLEAQGLISRRRGRVLVADRPGLERAACECYAAVRQHLDRVGNGLQAGNGRAR
jgi:CRP-like cAMP-binding protein